MFSKVNINLPLLNVIKNIPAYMKFFKDLNSKKRKLGDQEKVMISEVASAILQKHLPPKQNDPGSFTINIALGNGKETTGMLDLGAGINLMPYSIFKQLGLGELKPTKMCLQLADRSIRHPKGIIEDILVKVGKLIVPADFVVLEMGEVQTGGKEHTILLGRPFMATTNTSIDVKRGNLTMMVLGETAKFSIFNKTPTSNNALSDNCSFIDCIDLAVESVFLQEHIDFESVDTVKKKESVKKEIKNGMVNGRNRMTRRRCQIKPER